MAGEGSARTSGAQEVTNIIACRGGSFAFVVGARRGAGLFITHGGSVGRWWQWEGWREGTEG